MKKTSVLLKRYLYISQGKIGMYDCQLPRRWWQQPLVWLASLSRLKAGPLEIEHTFQQDAPSMHQKMQRIIEQLKREQAIGTVDQPATYIHDTLPLFQVLIPSRPGYLRQPDDPGFIYFGGGTTQTSLALVGSPHHLIGVIPDEKARNSSSDVPRLVQYINKRINEIVPGRPPRYDGLGAIWHADTYHTEPRTEMEFFAYRIHDSQQPQGIPTQEKRVLLYTPLFVAYKD